MNETPTTTPLLPEAEPHVRSVVRRRRVTGHRRQGRKLARGSARGRTAERIVEAGLKEFARNGFAGTSVRRIAKRARVQVPTLYHHFPSKEVIYQAAQERVHFQVRDVIRNVLGHGLDLRDTAREAIGLMFDFMVANRACVALGYRTRVEGTFPFDSVQRIVGEWVQMVEGLVKAARDAGMIRPVDPIALVVTIDVLIHGHIVSDDAYRSTFGKGVEDPEVAARVREHIIQVVLRTLGLDDGSS